MSGSRVTWALTLALALGAGCSWLASAERPAPSTGLSDDPDELYKNREDLGSARRAAQLWAGQPLTDYAAQWKLARVSYWLGTHGSDSDRRHALDRGVAAGESAAADAPDRPEGHFWLAANMGGLAQSFGLMQGLKYRGKIKSELERVVAIEPTWQGGLAEAVLGQWYLDVPRLFGGSRQRAEEHLRRALVCDPRNRLALSLLAEVLASSGRRDEARRTLQQVIDDPLDGEWMPEDKDLRDKAIERLRTLAK
jgi:hypothetical protein